MKNHRNQKIILIGLLVLVISMITIFFLQSSRDSLRNSNNITDLTRSVDYSITPDQGTPCINQFDMQICVTNKWDQNNQTMVSLAGRSNNPAMIPGDLYSLVDNLVMSNSLSNNAGPLIKDDTGNFVNFLQNEVIYRRSENGEALQTFSFPAIPSKLKQNSLEIPGFLATVTFEEPYNIQVDLGNDPELGQKIAIDRSVAILEQTIHFDEVVLQEDGQDRLRLSILSDTKDTTDTMYVKEFIFSEFIEGVSIMGSKGFWSPQTKIEVFSDLIDDRAVVKSGMFSFQITGAVIYVPGPFSFNIDSIGISSEPVSQPSPTFITKSEPTQIIVSNEPDLEKYLYFDVQVMSGDLVYAVVGEQDTELFRTGIETQFVPELVAILPGQVYQLFVHPDRLGIDYLSGIKKTDGDTVYYQSGQLFSLRFTDPTPRLLVSFPEGKMAWVGNDPVGTWSSDGRIFAFQYIGDNSGTGTLFRKIGRVDLNCRQNSDCHPKYINNPDDIDLFNMIISTKGNILVLEGANQKSDSGQPDIYSVDFSGNASGDLLNLTYTDWANESLVMWYPLTGEIAFKCPTDSTQTEYNFCLVNLLTHSQRHFDWLSYNVVSYQFSKTGNKIVFLDVNHSTVGKGIEEIRLWDWQGDGNVSQPLASESGFIQFGLSPTEDLFSYIDVSKNQIHIIDIIRAKEFMPLQEHTGKFVSCFNWIE